MASLSLRAYLQKIENLIDRGETEEAIAHCKHILKKFPKYVDTYRLLGKSYLEMQRYQEASDVLQRVLSVIPDDFVSQIGMSIIREDSENLDEAIWHMERAFEIQPSNNAVQDELKRLYGRRDGVIPQKILLTRGALVRMYVRGEAYPQAIAEGIAALKEDPQRADIQLLLAKSYLRTNQINEGYRICQKILESLPFSYEANQLIAEIHILTKQSNQAEPYLEHVRMLDPYAAFVNENAPTSAKVNENAIVIDELDYDEMASALEAAVSSSHSMYVDDDFDTSSLEIPTAGDSQPIDIDEDFSWMNDVVESTETEKPSEKQPSQEIQSQKEVDFPFDASSDFDNIQSEDIFSEENASDDDAFAALFAEMNDSSDESVEVDKIESSEQPTVDSQEPMTMAEFFENSVADLEKTDSDSVDRTVDDFAAIFDEQTSENEQASIPSVDITESMSEEEPKIQNESFTGEGTDDNLAAFFEEQNSIAEDQPVAVEKSITDQDNAVAADDLPDWLKELDRETKDSDIEEDLQKEIDSLFTNGDLPSSESEQISQEVSESQLDDEKEFTAKFLEDLENEPQHPGKTRMFSMTADLSSGDSGPLPPLSESDTPAEKATEEEIPDWLKQLEDQTNEFIENTEELPTSESQTEIKPESASSIDSMTEEEEDLLQEQYKAAQQSTKTTQMLSEEEDDDNSFAWLESLAAKQGVGEESSPVQEMQNESTLLEEIPQKPEVVDSAANAANVSIDAMTEEEEDQLREQFKSSEQTSKATQMLSDDEDDSFAWLESLAAKQGTPEDSVQPQQSIPDEVDEVSVEPIAAEPGQQKSASSIDSMTEEEEERLREQFKSSQQTGKVAQTASDDEDDSFAWLESLAAKQGASEETLLTNDGQRETAPPEWLQETTSSENIETPIAEPEFNGLFNNLEGITDSIEEEPVTISKLEQAEIPEDTEFGSKIEEPVWVDEFDTSGTEISKETQMLSPDSTEAELIQDTKEDDAVIPVLEEQTEETPIDQSSAQKIIGAPQTPDDIPDWLKDLEDQTSIYAITDKDDAGQYITDIEDVEIPGWIADVNETQQIDLDDSEEDETDDIPVVHAEYVSDEEIPEEEQSADAFKAIGLDIDELETQLQQEQIIEHIDGEKGVALIDEPPVQESVQVEESKQEEILAVEEETTDPIGEKEPVQTEEEIVFDIPSDFVDEILQEPEPTGPVLQIDEDDTQILTEMGKLIAENNIDTALSKADKLIEKEIYLESIIDELNKAIVDHPLDPAIFVRLGDAYIRSNEIQKALDMYQEAETLLQK